MAIQNDKKFTNVIQTLEGRHSRAGGNLLDHTTYKFSLLTKKATPKYLLSKTTKFIDSRLRGNDGFYQANGKLNYQFVKSNFDFHTLNLNMILMFS